TTGTAIVVWQSSTPSIGQMADVTPVAPVTSRVGANEAGERAAAPPPVAEIGPRWASSASATASIAALRSALERVLPVVAAAWFAGVLILSLRLGAGWACAQRLVLRGTQPAPAAVVRLVERLAHEIRLSRPVRVLLSGAVHVPAVVGWLRPAILVPVGALTGIDPRHLELLLLHELAHIRRHDYLVNLLQAVAETLLFHHPAVRWVGRRIRAEREHCCDDVAARLGGVREYVSALASMEELRRTRLPFALAADGGSLLARVLRLVERPSGPASPARLLGALAVLLATAAAGVMLLSGNHAESARPYRAAAALSPARPLPAVAIPCPGAPAAAGSTRCPELERSVTELLARRAPGSIALVQDVATGAVLAYAATGTGDDASALTRAALPGSVWKLVVASLWWESGKGDQPVACPASITVDGRTVRNFSRKLPASLAGAHEMLVYSCNTAAVGMALQLRDVLGGSGVDEGLRRLGFGGAGAGRDTTFWATRSAEFRTRMSPELPAGGITGDRRDWADFGLGNRRTTVSPLHVTRFLQAIGNGGVMQQPTVDAALAGTSPGHRVLSPATAARLQAAMRDVVRRGTARGADTLLASSPWQLAGKTGTVDGGLPDSDGWFAGLALDASGRARYTVVVRLPGGGPGGGEPARIAARIVRLLPEASGATQTASRSAAGATTRG
ncbi:MAG TPA: M56 family metallopeptidase, partial [Longimicrobium sp.]|nr:M56 family metallopeptidase [Longimicrobium sp.]